jgi:hypothetical protein
MANSRLRRTGPTPISLEPLYDELLKVLGEGQESTAAYLTELVVEVIADELFQQRNCSALARKHRAYVSRCLEQSIWEWLEWRLP